jgi:putative hemolysin
MKRKPALILIVVLVLLIIFVLYLIAKNKNTSIITTPTTVENLSPTPTSDKIINSVTFYCHPNKEIKAVFYEDKVEITLSDGRNMTLPQVISASGARYANSDESFVFWNKGDTAFITEKDKTTYENCAIKIINTPKAQMANPASTNCADKGGQSKIQTKPDGSQYSLCFFDDNRACEEWAMYRGECPVGGVKTTGYDTEAQKYCAWSGGKTYAVTNAICSFSDGSTCFDEAFYSGTCQKGTK